MEQFISLFRTKSQRKLRDKLIVVAAALCAVFQSVSPRAQDCAGAGCDDYGIKEANSNSYCRATEGERTAWPEQVGTASGRQSL